MITQMLCNFFEVEMNKKGNEVLTMEPAHSVSVLSTMHSLVHVSSALR